MGETREGGGVSPEPRVIEAGEQPNPVSPLENFSIIKKLQNALAAQESFQKERAAAQESLQKESAKKLGKTLATREEKLALITTLKEDGKKALQGLDIVQKEIEGVKEQGHDLSPQLEGFKTELEQIIQELKKQIDSLNEEIKGLESEDVVEGLHGEALKEESLQERLKKLDEEREEAETSRLEREETLKKLEQYREDIDVAQKALVDLYREDGGWWILTTPEIDRGVLSGYGKEQYSLEKKIKEGQDQLREKRKLLSSKENSFFKIGLKRLLEEIEEKDREVYKLQNELKDMKPRSVQLGKKYKKLIETAVKAVHAYNKTFHTAQDNGAIKKGSKEEEVSASLESKNLEIWNKNYTYPNGMSILFKDYGYDRDAAMSELEKS